MEMASWFLLVAGLLALFGGYFLLERSSFGRPVVLAGMANIALAGAVLLGRDGNGLTVAVVGGLSLCAAAVVAALTMAFHRTWRAALPEIVLAGVTIGGLVILYLIADVASQNVRTAAVAVVIAAGSCFVGVSLLRALRVLRRAS